MPKRSPTEATTPAQKASFLSPQLASERRREAWLDLFATDAVVEDPVGRSLFDPTGLGHRGREAIARFYDTIILAAGRMEFTIQASYPRGDECANVCLARFTQPNGSVSETPMVVLYKVDAEGKIVSLRAFWDASRLDQSA